MVTIMASRRIRAYEDDLTERRNCDVSATLNANHGEKQMTRKSLGLDETRRTVVGVTERRRRFAGDGLSPFELATARWAGAAGASFA